MAELAARCASLLDLPPSQTAPVELVDARGPGFGVASEAGERAAAVALREDGLLLDRVYTAKAFAVALGMTEGPVVFWHTGGTVSAVAHL
jgi:D-cysteine desulfhydrase